MPAPDSGFRGVSLKNGLVDEVEKFVKEHHEYKNTADFVHEAVRVHLKELRKEKAIQKPLPRFEHFNIDPDGVRISDRKLNMIADIYFKPEGVFCDLDKSNECEHIEFALTVPAIQDLMRRKCKEGWKLPGPDV